MAISESLCGMLVDLIPVETTDADFTMQIRNDESMTQYIPRIDTTLDKQKQWIEHQREKQGDYFYIITDKKGAKLGTAAVYDVNTDESIGEYGRYISYGNAFENVETALLSLKFAFYELKLQTVMFNNDTRNKKIISFWKRFGAEYNKEYDYGTWTAARYLLSKERFEECRPRIEQLLTGRK